MNRKWHKSMIFLIFVVFLLGSVVFSQITSVYSKAMVKERELSNLQQELTIEKARKVNLEEEAAYIDSDEFIIKKAREEFNLIRDGETLYIKRNE